MTDSVIIGAPLLIAAIVMAVRFVGCSFDPSAYRAHSPYSTAVLGTANLVSFWRLNEPMGSTTAHDSSDGNNGTYQGSVTFHAQGLVSPDSGDTDNFAAGFDGTTGYVSVPFNKNLNPTNPKQFSVEVLVEPAIIDPNNRRTIVSSFDDPDQTGYILALNNTDFEARVGTGADIETVAVHANAQANQSYYVVMTYDGTNLELYVDPAATEIGISGQLDKALFVGADPNHERYDTAQFAYKAQTKSQYELRIGAHAGGAQPGEFFQGAIQDVAVYKAALNFLDIASHYWNYKTGIEIPGQGKPGAGLAGEGALSVKAEFPKQSPPPPPTNYTPAGTYTYTIPWWCTYIDLILLGGGGGGSNAGSQAGSGGGAGFWTTHTYQRGANIPWTTTSITVKVGSGGAGGSGFQMAHDGGPTTATVNGMTTTAPGGIAGASVSGTTGQGPGDKTYNNTTAHGGADQTTPGGPGIGPGGGGGGAAAFGFGGAGADGAAWLVARQP
jgi:hypothetical protein